MLMRLYTESDLLAAQSLLDGAWRELDPAELAAVCAAVVYESRGHDDDTPPGPAHPGRAGGRRAARRRCGPSCTSWRPGTASTSPGSPDAGIVDATYRWASGANLLQVLTHADITAGDFVRWIRQVIDLLGQIAQAVDPARPDARHRALRRPTWSTAASWPTRRRSDAAARPREVVHLAAARPTPRSAPPGRSASAGSRGSAAPAAGSGQVA